MWYPVKSWMVQLANANLPTNKNLVERQQVLLQSTTTY